MPSSTIILAVARVPSIAQSSSKVLFDSLAKPLPAGAKILLGVVKLCSSRSRTVCANDAPPALVAGVVWAEATVNESADCLPIVVAAVVRASSPLFREAATAASTRDALSTSDGSVSSDLKRDT